VELRMGLAVGRNLDLVTCLPEPVSRSSGAATRRPMRGRISLGCRDSAPYPGPSLAR
jgi:hypothetical protein